MSIQSQMITCLLWWLCWRDDDFGWTEFIVTSIGWLIMAIILSACLMFHFLLLLSMYFIVTRLNVFNYSCHSVRVLCWIKRLLTYLLNECKQKHTK